MNKSKYELVLCIVNAGFSEAVMDAAKEVGARGGTPINRTQEALQTERLNNFLTLQFNLIKKL